jgi:hypothetical protein
MSLLEADEVWHVRVITGRPEKVSHFSVQVSTTITNPAAARRLRGFEVCLETGELFIFYLRSHVIG